MSWIRIQGYLFLRKLLMLFQKIVFMKKYKPLWGGLVVELSGLLFDLILHPLSLRVYTLP
jgi:hypothetical protein